MLEKLLWSNNNAKYLKKIRRASGKASRRRKLSDRGEPNNVTKGKGEVGG